MNKIIGMAGHVDHGKSSLVTLLTNEEMMRLPEEKKRNMTLDLGFGSFLLDELQIGVIDVPGHEDFIRNMVSGMWSLDLVLLVVAADEGWMPMTLQHAKVARALGITTICVLNKCDLVDNNNLEIQQKLIQEHLYAIFDKQIPIIPLSTKTKEGISALKNRIKQQLSLKSNKIKLSSYPYLYIDRVFTVKGHGLTVTGSLQGGELNKDDSLFLYPRNKELRCKSIQSYHKEYSSVSSPTRVALNLKNIDYQDISRGDLLSTNQDNVFSTKSLIIHLEYSDSCNDKNKYIECAVGTACIMGHMIPIKGTPLIRVELEKEIPVFWQQKVLLINYGGSTIFGSGSIFWINATTTKERQIIKLIDPKIIYEKNILSFKELQLHSFGYYYTNSSKKQARDIVIDERFLTEQKTKCLSLMENSKYSLIAVSQKLKLPINIVQIILDNLCESKQIIQDQDCYVKFSLDTVILSHTQQELLTKLQLNKFQGILEKDLLSIKNGKKDMFYLTSINKAIFLGEGIFYDMKHYNNIKSTLLKNKKINDVISISEVREKLDVSRKYVIPIFNMMEKENILQRIDSDRIVKKI